MNTMHSIRNRNSHTLRAAAALTGALLCIVGNAWARDFREWVVTDAPGTPFCGLPSTFLDEPAALEQHPYPTTRIIEFVIPIYPGVHEKFNAELVAVMGFHQFPANTTDYFKKFFELHPEAHCAVQYDGIVIGNDCDGDGEYTPGPGNPPCWGNPTATLEPVDFSENDYPRDFRASPSCTSAPRFKLRISGPPILNSGIVGIKVLGANRNLFMGGAAWSEPNNPISGHAWVNFTRPIVGFSKSWGKYPVPDANGNNQPFAPGVIRDDSGNSARHIAWFPVTLKEWNDAVKVVRDNMPPNDCSQFNLLTANCTHFMREVMLAAGCPVPSAAIFGIPGSASPLAYSLTCEQILQTTTFLPRCGFLQGLQPLHGGGSGTIDAAVAGNLLRENPQLLATQLGFAFSQSDLEACALRTGTNLQLQVTGEPQSLVSIDFGDGTHDLGSIGTRTHAYGKPGTYTVTVGVLVNGEVRMHRLQVTVAAKGPKGATRTVQIAKAGQFVFPPVEDHPEPPSFMRAFPGDVNSSYSVDGEDLATVLAEWGSTAVTMSDINEDGVVNGNDLAIVLAGWGASVN